MILGIIGTEPSARAIMPYAEAAAAVELSETVEAVFVSPDNTTTGLDGKRCLSFDDYLQMDPAGTRFALAVTDTYEREALANRLSEAGFSPASLRHETWGALPGVSIGEGDLFGQFVAITTRQTIGRYFQAFAYSYVAHDCAVGDFVTLGARACCNGNVIVGNHVTIGMGAMKIGRASCRERV